MEREKTDSNANSARTWAAWEDIFKYLCNDATKDGIKTIYSSLFLKSLISSSSVKEAPSMPDAGQHQRDSQLLQSRFRHKQRQELQVRYDANKTRRCM
jgi:hypothetical protein